MIPKPAENPFRLKTRPVLMAHRGAPTERPENTLSSFRRALEVGADVLEMDVRRTSDGHLVVSHDDRLERTTNGQGRVHETSFAALRQLKVRVPEAQGQVLTEEHICTFEEVLRSFPDAAMNVDLKDVHPGDVDQAFRTIREAFAGRTVLPHLLLTSSSAETQARIAQLNRGEVSLGMGERAVYGILMGAYFGRKIDPTLRGRSCQLPLYMHVLGVRLPVVTQRVINYLKANDITIHVWKDENDAVDDPQAIKKWAQKGVDGFFTDRIGEVAAYFKAENERS